ncbi:MAG TPA: PH domain-containing protein [Chitinophagaceae bacterium]
MHPQIDWSSPQRQPVAGLLVVVLKTFWDVMKRAWPIILLMLFRRESGLGRFEILTMVIAGLALVSGFMNFYFFKFYINNNELTIKKGWLKKSTHVVPLNRIHSAHIEQSFLHKMLNIVKLSIDTAGSDKSEITIDALHRSMADELKTRLINKETSSTKEEHVEVELPIVHLNTSDLVKLSISANHIEALLILISFGFGILENIRQINEDLIPDANVLVPSGSAIAIAYMIVGVLLLTMLVSTAGIFLRYFNFTVRQTLSGYHIRSGLFTVKERVITLKKVQYISWKANWIRKLMGLWMLEYHVAGSDDEKSLMKAKVPLTDVKALHILTNQYHPLPDFTLVEPLRIHPSYAWRRAVLAGILPTAIAITILWTFWQERSLFLLLYPIYMTIASIQFRKKFQLRAYEDVLMIRRGILGEEFVLLQWHHLQTIIMTQSMYQRRKGLANVKLYTAAGMVKIPYADLSSVQALVNFALYKTESTKKNWM